MLRFTLQREKQPRLDMQHIQWCSFAWGLTVDIIFRGSAPIWRNTGLNNKNITEAFLWYYFSWTEIRKSLTHNEAASQTPILNISVKYELDLQVFPPSAPLLWSTLSMLVLDCMYGGSIKILQFQRIAFCIHNRTKHNFKAVQSNCIAYNNSVCRSACKVIPVKNSNNDVKRAKCSWPQIHQPTK